MGQKEAAELSMIVEYFGGVPVTGKVAFWTMIAEKLSAAVGQDPPWLRHYPAKVYAGQIDPSPAFSRAVMVLGAMIDGMPIDVASTEPVQVYAKPGTVRPGSLILAESRICANPACRVSFIPRAWNQSCHSPDCAKVVRKLRRQKKGNPNG